MQILLILFELIGTAAFAVSGAFVAIAKKMDLLGVAVLGMTTAVGGGIIRDVLLGVTPPASLRNPLYALAAIVCALLTFLPAVRRIFTERQNLCDRILLIADSVGLGVFSVVGVRAAIAAGFGDNLFLQVFVGAMTGVGGGVLRDVMADSTPYIFAKHIYACASLAGALLCAVLWRFFGELPSMIVGAVLTFVLRLLAAKFRWSLPKA